MISRFYLISARTFSPLVHWLCSEGIASLGNFKHSHQLASSHETNRARSLARNTWKSTRLWKVIGLLSSIYVRGSTMCFRHFAWSLRNVLCIKSIYFLFRTQRWAQDKNTNNRALNTLFCYNVVLQIVFNVDLIEMIRISCKPHWRARIIYHAIKFPFPTFTLSHPRPFPLYSTFDSQRECFHMHHQRRDKVKLVFLCILWEPS